MESRLAEQIVVSLPDGFALQDRAVANLELGAGVFAFSLRCHLSALIQGDLKAAEVTFWSPKSSVWLHICVHLDPFKGKVKL